MELINDLSSDLAFAVFVEKRHEQKIDSREAKSLIARVESVLLSTSSKPFDGLVTPHTEASATALSH